MILGPAGPTTRWAGWAAAIVLLTGLGPLSVWAQDPDSIRADTTAVDSVAVEESIALAQEADTIVDSLAVSNVPQLPTAPAAGWSNGQWEWDRPALLRAPGLTVADLVYEIPGITALKGGDYGSPASLSAFGAAAGRIRVILDGFELVPLTGGVPDLALIGLAGIERVRVRRSLGGLVVDLQTLQYADSRAFTQIEAGTGDLDTNAFRGTFALPGALGGHLLVTLDRLDTRGRDNADVGTIGGVSLRYSLLRGDRGGLEAQYSRRAAERTFYQPGDLTRNDWTIRGRHRVGSSLVAAVYYGSSSITADDPAVADGTLTGPDVGQWGVQVGLDRASVWGSSTVRGFSGMGYPSLTVDLDGGLRREGLGGIGVEWQRQSWDATSTSRFTGRVWTEPLFGFSAFAEVDRGEVGIAQPPDFTTPPVPADSLADSGTDSAVVTLVAPERFDSRETVRYGARFSAGRLDLSAARISVDADSIFPLGLPVDRTPFPVPGGKREGWEATAVVPLLILDGLTARGSVQRWDSIDGSWPYLPRLQYDARVRYANTFLPTGNFELLVEFGAREREAMSVFEPDSTGQLIIDPDGPTDSEEPRLPSVATVPFLQNWYARLQIRIVTLLLYVEWENVTLRPDNQDFPGRILPRTRAQYGVRWRLWN